LFALSWSSIRSGESHPQNRIATAPILAQGNIAGKRKPPGSYRCQACDIASFRDCERWSGMTSLYFACTDCKVYIDAGYRWAAWWLEEPGVVRRGKQVAVDLVLSAPEYWSPERNKGAQWLYGEALSSCLSI